MEPTFRERFNAAFSDDLYRRYLHRLEHNLGHPVAFRVAESPAFLPRPLRVKLATAAREIVAKISKPDVIAAMKPAIPSRFDVPGLDALPACAVVDFAVVREPDGSLGGRVVELQGFPSLYALMVLQSEALAAELQAIRGLDREWSVFYGGLDRHRFIERFKEALITDIDPEEVVMVDLHPAAQKTYGDFLATQHLTGVDHVALHELTRQGQRIFREKNGRRVPVRRIYNRVVFDELERSGIAAPFDWREPLDVSWFPHPNWYWLWSKYTLPHIDHPAIPRARLLSEIDAVPSDLSRYVLKPLFSFAGGGVNVDVTEKDLVAVPRAERSGWLLQEKIDYAPALRAVDGGGVKIEVRMMFLKRPRDPVPELVLNLVRMSRGSMMGVDQNRAATWVGGSVGIFPADEDPV